MKKITLTKGMFALVDDKDYDYLNQWKWFASKGYKTYYPRRKTRINENLKDINGNKKKVNMHTFLLNPPLNMQIDHIDHNGLNCQRNNLRICTQNQNQANRIKLKGNCKSLGVCIKIIDKKYKYYRAMIKTNGVRIELGHFKTEIEAAKAYDKAAIKYHGEFANLNFK